MSMLSCSFCAHRNPDRSKFCNECGSPLHLAPCEQCAAVNDRTAAACHQCGAPLPAIAPMEVSLAEPASPPEGVGESDRERVAAPAMADPTDSRAEPVFVAPVAGAVLLGDDVQHHLAANAPGEVAADVAADVVADIPADIPAMAPASHNSVPTALAGRLDARHWLADAATVASHKPREADPLRSQSFTLGLDDVPARFTARTAEMSQAVATADLDAVDVLDPVRVVNSLAEVDVHAPRRRPTPAYPRRRRSHAVVLAIAVAGVAGAMAWSAWDPALIDSMPEWFAALMPTRQSTVAPATDIRSRGARPAGGESPPPSVQAPQAPVQAPPGAVQAPPASVQAPSTSVQTPTTAAQAPSSSESGPMAPSASAAVLPADRTLASLPPLDDALPPAPLDTVAALDTMPRLMPLEEVVVGLPAARSSRAGDTRSREQAERDALATQRLIARDLADFRRQSR
jgi:hypothetical protein